MSKILEIIKKVEFDGKEFTVVNWHGEWCYIDTELSDYLEYAQVSNMTRTIDEKYMIKIKNKEWEEFKLNNSLSDLFECGRKGFYLIKELGVYECIIKSKPQTESRIAIVDTFKDWVYKTIQSIRKDYGLNAWETIMLMSVEDSKIIGKEYDDVCDDIDKKPNYIVLWQMINKLICFYYDVEYSKDIKTDSFRKTEYPNIIHDRKVIGRLFIRYFGMTGSHKEAYERAIIKLTKEKDKYKE